MDRLTGELVAPIAPCVIAEPSAPYVPIRQSVNSSIRQFGLPVIMHARAFCCLSLAVLLWVPCASAQEKPVATPDALGRDTPRGSVVGFITAGRDGKYQLAAQYLNPGTQ